MEHADDGFAAVEGRRPPCVELPESNVIRVGPAVSRRVTFRLPPHCLGNRHGIVKGDGEEAVVHVNISKEKEDSETRPGIAVPGLPPLPESIS
jgi:hypothetical protein